MYLEVCLIFHGLLNYSQVGVLNCYCHLKSKCPAGVLHGTL